MKYSLTGQFADFQSYFTKEKDKIPPWKLVPRAINTISHWKEQQKKKNNKALKILQTTEKSILH